MNSLLNLTAEQLRKAAAIKEQIDALQDELNQLMGTTAQAAAPAEVKKRRMSAAGRARIGAAARARWAKLRAQKGSSQPAKRPKKKISAAGKAKLSALAKARWAKAKAAGRVRL